ncbi:hypothetical protein CWB99_17935 [Pseudoalteromonas rubra]|uniref:Uncharacterized protein n=1 Tax=Pseudoalteromonas rubra TaxID=43658 RepID=A0A5S3WI93_9GAMM|nr:hypothetical protein CWB99_17935 [Pseudoalteromonas rubra]TMP30712.1 hypothetical protein CWC00_16165 [Pseudoalteromonas rubra]
MTPLGVTQQPPYILLATLLISVTVDMNSKSPPQGFFHFRSKNRLGFHKHITKNTAMKGSMATSYA